MRRNCTRLFLFRNTSLSIALHLHLCKVVKRQSDHKVNTFLFPRKYFAYSTFPPFSFSSPILLKNSLTTEGSNAIIIAIQGQLAQLVRAPR